MAYFRCTGNSGGSLKLRTASGDIASFETNLPEPLQSVIVDIEATGGNGTPDSPIPVNGYTEANITRCGVNLFKTTATSKTESGVTWTVNEDGTITVSGTATGYTDIYAGKAKVNKNMTLYISGLVNTVNIVYSVFRLYDINNTLIATIPGGNYANLTLDLSTYPDVDSIEILYKRNNNVAISGTIKPMVNIGGSYLPFEPYNGQTYTIAFGQTVYGGVLDVTRGKLTSGKDKASYNGSEGWYEYARGTNTVVYALQNAVVSILNENDQISNVFTYNARAFDASLNTPNIFVLGTSKRLYAQVSATDYPTVTAFQTALSNNNLEVLYNITPFDIDLTPEVISAVVGTNNVFADCGETEVKYLYLE